MTIHSTEAEVLKQRKTAKISNHQTSLNQATVKLVTKLVLQMCSQKIKKDGVAEVQRENTSTPDKLGACDLVFFICNKRKSANVQTQPRSKHAFCVILHRNSGQPNTYRECLFIAKITLMDVYKRAICMSHHCQNTACVA